MRVRRSAECTIPVLHGAHVAVHHGHGIPAGMQIPFPWGLPFPASPDFSLSTPGPFSLIALGCVCGGGEGTSWAREAHCNLATTAQSTTGPLSRKCARVLPSHAIRVPTCEALETGLEVPETDKSTLAATTEPSTGQGTCAPNFLLVLAAPSVHSLARPL